MMTPDYFLYDTEQLGRLSTPETVKRGLAYFNENRVFAVALQEDMLTAQVEGSRQDLPYWVELSVDKNGELQSDCDCASADKICKHAIATLYSYAEYCLDQEQESFGGAVDAAIKSVSKKGEMKSMLNSSVVI